MDPRKDSPASEFLLVEYQNLYQNVMAIERRLFHHLLFCLITFIGIVTASLALYQLLMLATPSTNERAAAVARLSLLFVLFVIVGQFELRLIGSLHIQKVKFIEGLAQIRQYFVANEEAIAPYLALPVGLHKNPPSFSPRSQDWYLVVFLSLMNGLAAAIAWVSPLWILALWLVHTHTPTIIVGAAVSIWILLGLAAFGLVFLKWSYQSVADSCSIYDRAHEEKTGITNGYGLIEQARPRSR